MRQSHQGWKKRCTGEMPYAEKACAVCAFRERQSQTHLPASSGRNACVDPQTPETSIQRNSSLDRQSFLREMGPKMETRCSQNFTEKPHFWENPQKELVTLLSLAGLGGVPPPGPVPSHRGQLASESWHHDQPI